MTRIAAFEKVPVPTTAVHVRLLKFVAVAVLVVYEEGQATVLFPAKAVGGLYTVKEKVFPLETVFVQPPVTPMETMVTVVDPALESEAVVKVPAPVLKIMVDVALVAVLLPVRL